MREPLSYDIAYGVASSALEVGRAEGARICVAVVNRSGITKIVLADDGVGPIGVATARRKAYTAAVTGMPTAMFAAFAADSVTPPHVVDPELLPAPGGLPIVVDEEVIGGIGVGGSPGETDEKIASKALEQLRVLDS